MFSIAELSLNVCILAYAMVGWALIVSVDPARFLKAGGRIGRIVFVESVYIATVAEVVYSVLLALSVTLLAGNTSFLAYAVSIAFSAAVAYYLNLIIDTEPFSLYVESFVHR